MAIITYLSNNNIPKRIYLLISSIHTDGEKYRIFSVKTETDTNTTIHKMN